MQFYNVSDRSTYRVLTFDSCFELCTRATEQLNGNQLSGKHPPFRPRELSIADDVASEPHRAGREVEQEKIRVIKHKSWTRKSGFA
jgi:hypothetical protein